MANTVSKLLNVALNEVGYLEKASNSQLDSKTENAGRNNYTKYARDLDALKTFYNTPKQGVAWCDVFVDWCFVQAFGREEAQKLLNQPDKSCGAGCGFSANYFKKINRFYTKPQPGDQIFFLDSVGDVAHTGLVYAVDSERVYTVEGNTSGASGVVANGGGVCKKSYALNYNRIYGYGRANFDAETNVQKTPQQTTTTNVLKLGDSGAKVIALQQRLIKLGYSCGPDGADGNFGSNTEKAVQAFQEDRKLEADGKVGPLTQKELDKIMPGDIIKLKSGARYASGLVIPKWVINSVCYARKKEDAKGNIVFSISRTGGITGIVSKNYLETSQAVGYKVVVTARSGLNVRQGAGTKYARIRTLAYNSKQTIIEEKNGWGKLANGGWVSLSYVKKV